LNNKFFSILYIFIIFFEILPNTMKIINDLINLIKYKETPDYNFILPDADASQDSQVSNTAPE